ncbi:hypothetical protein BD779DRAFT_1607830 [Infundibulicybe gibba]|nr:hypothetical protein BD779DRAFT_1607830 [Infundibulicybe gibba]
MPPRRSSRTARASVEPVPETLPSKRKRASTNNPGLEDETTIKPAAKARRGPSTGPGMARGSSTRRPSSRAKISLPDVPESGSEEESSPEPPVKRARPSSRTKKPREEEQEQEDVVDESEEEQEELKPKTKERAVRATSKARGGKKQVTDNEMPPAKAPKPRSTRASLNTGSSGSRKPNSRAQLQPEVDSSVGRTSLPARTGARSLGRVSTRRASKQEDSTPQPLPQASDDASDDNSEDELVTKPVLADRSSRKAKPAARVRKESVKVEQPEEEEEEEVEVKDEEEVKGEVEEEEEGKEEAEGEAVDSNEGRVEAEEEEKSLFDPPSMPAPSTLPPPVPEDTGPKSRLVIHKMALVNFKSYAGRQEIGPFHKVCPASRMRYVYSPYFLQSFSSIVGPNGSGKSNTIDALLFVFGYRASKMRQGKLSELIHNSARYPNLDECSVEVHFRDIFDLPGPDAFRVVPGSQLVVQNLLKGRGIDLDHKRFLILQGEVESIAQMRPKAQNEHDEGLLEYLEDIIGTSKYKEPIEEAMVDMERLQEERGEKLNRLRIVEKEKSALENKKREAEDYLRLHNDHVRARSKYWQFLLWQCLVNEDKLNVKMEGFKRELAEETDRNKDDIAHLELLHEHYQKREKAYDEVQAAAAEATEDLASHEKREVGLQERRKHTASKSKKLNKSLQDDTAAMNKALRAIEDSSEKMSREKTKVEDHEASLIAEEKVLEGIRDSLKDKTQVFHDQIEVKQKELQPWTAKINKKQAEVDVASSERDALAKKAAAIGESSREASETLTQLQSDLESMSMSSNIPQLQEQTRHRTSKSNLQQEIANAQNKLKQCQANVQEWKTKASSSRHKVEEAKASQADNRSQNRVLDSLTRLKNAGRISGFHGRLGSLGTIPDKYDVAISTACGSLHHMVVDKVDQGQACIEYLRSQNVGRASFMVLEKITQTHGMEKIATPENVPRLFDLIKPKEPRFAPAFYKAIGNTLVAENMDQANRIAFGQKRWRVVTLTGQLIDIAGTMSGGGSQPIRGGMSSKLAADAVRPEVLREYEQDSEEATRRLEAAMQELHTAEAELDRLQKSGPEIEMAVHKLGLDIENGKKRIAEAEKRVRDLKAASKPNAQDVARISTLDAEIASSTEELEALHAKSGKIEQAIKDLEKKILDIGGARLLTQKSKVDGIKLHINIANDEITKAEVAKAKAEKDSARLETVIEGYQTSIKEVDADLKELEGQLKELDTYVAELRGKVEAAQAAAENSKEDLENLKAELDEKDEKIQGFRQKEMALKQSISDTEKESKENGQIMEHWQTKHDSLTLEEIDDDDDDEAEEEDGDENKQGDAPEQDEPGPSKRKNDRDHTPSYELHVYSAEELSKFKKRELSATVELLDEQLKNAKPDLSVLKEYKKRKEEFDNRVHDLERVTKQRDDQKQKYDGLRKQRLDEFMAGFNLISLKLKEMYQMITLGGNAELELVDSLDPFSEGIIFSVMPPKKSWKNISNLSGGEKTLSSLALVFALHVFKPTPLYFMDEIDAALDFRNVSIVANYIKDRTKNAQFIIISLRNDMFELSHRLIGIYKTANATQSISIDNHVLTSSISKSVNVT